MPVSETLQSPLVHVQQQFIQNCCFTFDGSTFRATTQLVCLADYCLKSNRVLVVQDYFDVVKTVQPHLLNEFLNLAEQTLGVAVSKYEQDYACAKAQFLKLITPVESVDETAD